MKNVLIVDDAIFMRQTLRQMLENNEYNIVGEAHDGREALSLYQELKPDIVTMDITMPEMDGIEAVKQIKSIDPEATIVIITAIGEEKKVQRAIEAGAVGFIVKPFKEPDVVKMLNRL